MAQDPHPSYGPHSLRLMSTRLMEARETAAATAPAATTLIPRALRVSGLAAAAILAAGVPAIVGAEGATLETRVERLETRVERLETSVSGLTNSVKGLEMNLSGFFVVTVGGGLLLRGEMRDDVRKRDAAMEVQRQEDRAERQEDKAAMDKRMDMTFSVALAGIFVPALTAILPYLGPYLQTK